MNDIILKLDANAVNVVLASVRKAPWEIAHPVLVAIEEQIRAQTQPVPIEKKADNKK